MSQDIPKFILDRVSKYRFKKQKVVRLKDLNENFKIKAPLDFVINLEKLITFDELINFMKALIQLSSQKGLYVSVAEILEERRILIR